MSGDLLRCAATAAEDLLGSVFRLHVRKALDPLDDDDFLVIVDRIGRALGKATRKSEAAALRAALDVLDVDWAKLTELARVRVINAARKAMDALSSAVLPKVDQVLAVQAPQLIGWTRTGVHQRFGIRVGTRTDLIDGRIAAFTRRSESLFIRDELGRRQLELSQRARNVVAEGLERGLGRDDIASQLAAELAPVVARGPAYWQTIAASFAARARSYTELDSFNEAGIERFRFEAVLDQVTSSICRFMHGREFSVERARQRFDQVEGAQTPEQIADLQPWVRSGRDHAGNQVLFFERAGHRHLVARIDQPAVGRLDEVGRYSRALGVDALEAAGITAPPLHGRCRSTLIPA